MRQFDSRKMDNETVEKKPRALYKEVSRVGQGDKVTVRKRSHSTCRKRNLSAKWGLGGNREKSFQIRLPFP